MARESESMPNKFERFKQRINYPVIVQHITDNTKIVMNWSELLKEIKLLDGTVWKSHANTIGMGIKKSGSISDYFENDRNDVHIEVTVFTDFTNKQVIEEAMIATSFTSAMDIVKEYLPDGPGDFYLYYPKKDLSNITGDKNARCVFRNVMIKVDTTQDDLDVRPIVEHLVAEMSAALVTTDQLPRIPHKPILSELNPKVGSVFYVDIVFPTSARLETYEIDLQTDNLPEGLEYVDFKDNKYYLKATRPGLYRFELWIMDRRTLLIETVHATVNVSAE